MWFYFFLTEKSNGTKEAGVTPLTPLTPTSPDDLQQVLNFPPSNQLSTLKPCYICTLFHYGHHYCGEFFGVGVLYHAMSVKSRWIPANNNCFYYNYCPITIPPAHSGLNRGMCSRYGKHSPLNLAICPFSELTFIS